MKRIIAIALAVLMLSQLSACGTPEPSGTLPPQTQAPTQSTEPAATDPVQTEPADTVPPVTDPTVTVPAVTDPAPTDTVPPTVAPTDGPNLEALDTTVNTWGPGVDRDEANRPNACLNLQKKFGEYEAYFIAPPEGQIYLTFDEGYENGYTSRILDTLKEKNVKAVFFVTMPYCKENPDLVRRMIDEGHAVGNHSVRHKSMPTLTIHEMIDEVMGLHDYVKEHFGYEMHLFRPPMGEFSRQSLAVLQSLGYKTVQWSFAYYDYDPEDQMKPDKAFKKVTGAAHEGAIYLLHAISETNTEILGDVIDELQSRGYRLELFN